MGPNLLGMEFWIQTWKECASGGGGRSSYLHILVAKLD
jgi:hypothetical protein